MRKLLFLLNTKWHRFSNSNKSVDVRQREKKKRRTYTQFMILFEDILSTIMDTQLYLSCKECLMKMSKNKSNDNKTYIENNEQQQYQTSITLID